MVASPYQAHFYRAMEAFTSRESEIGGFENFNFVAVLAELLSMLRSVVDTKN